MPQPGFFDLDECYARLNERDPLVKLNQLIDKENAQIKAGETSERFAVNPSVKSRKDTQARWPSKHQETHFGYKKHIAIDKESLIESEIP